MSTFTTQFQASAWAQMVAVLGETITIGAPGVGATSVSVVWNDLGKDKAFQDDGTRLESSAEVQVANADYAASINDIATRSSVPFKVMGVRSESSGLDVLRVTRKEPEERSRSFRSSNS